MSHEEREYAKLREVVKLQREMLTEVIHTFYMNDNDDTTWAETGLGKRIADHLGLKSTQPRHTPTK
jgi:hypothetical protein